MQYATGLRDLASGDGLVQGLQLFCHVGAEQAQDPLQQFDIVVKTLAYDGFGFQQGFVGCRGRGLGKGWLASLAKLGQQGGDQLFEGNGLAHMLIHAGSQAELAIRFRSIGGHGDDGQVGKLRVGPDLAGGLQPVNIRHLHVDQHGIKRGGLLQYHGHPVPPAFGQQHPGPFAAQQLAGDLAVEQIVLHHQQGEATQPAGVLGRESGRDVLAMEGLIDGLCQLLGSHGFGQQADEGGGARLVRLGEHLVAVGGDHDDSGGWVLPGLLPDLGGGVQSIHARHAPVHQHYVEGTAQSTGLADPADGLGPRVNQLGLPAELQQGALQQLCRQLAVVDHQNVGGRCQVRAGLLERLGGGLCQGDVEPEAAATARFTLDPQLCPHQLEQAFADHQPQPGAAEATGGGGFGLGEALEDALQLVGADADAAVGDGHADGDRLLMAGQQCHGDHHLALDGELEGIARQVGEHLLQAHAVTDQVIGQVGVDIEHDLDLFLALVAVQYDGQVPHQQLDVEGVQIELQLAGLDLRVVENVVEQAQQGVGRRVRLDHIVELAGGELGVLDQLQHAEHGVEGGADLVAHVGEEGGLGLAGGICLLLGIEQAGLQLGLGCDVPVEADDAQRLTAAVPLHLGSGLDHPVIAVVLHHPKDGVVDAGAGHGAVQAGGGGRQIVRVHPVCPVLVVEPLLPERQRQIVELEHAVVPAQGVAAELP